MRASQFAFLMASALSLSACGDKRVDPRGLDRDETLLQVQASGRAENRPDEARFTAGVSAIAATGPAASEANVLKMNKVVAAIEALGITKEDIRTTSLTVNRLDWGPNKGKFEAQNTVSVRIRQLDEDGKKASDAVGAATGAGANIMSGPDLVVSDREAATKSAYAAAYKAARTRADAYAEAAGLKIDRVLIIRDGGQAGGPPMPYPTAVSVDAVANEQAGPVIRPGLEQAEVAVQVDFALVPK